MRTGSGNGKRLRGTGTGGGRTLTPGALLRYAPLLVGIAVVLAVVLSHAYSLSARTHDGSAVALTAEVVDGGVALSWNAPAGADVAGYRILRRYASEDAELEVLVENTGSAATSYLDAALRPGTEYVYRVQPIGADGDGARSNYVRLKTPEPPAGASDKLEGDRCCPRFPTRTPASPRSTSRSCSGRLRPHTMRD